MKAVSPDLPCSGNMYVENNRQLQRFHVCLQLECTLLLRCPREAAGYGLLGLGKFSGPHWKRKWDALSREKGAPLEGGWKLMPSWGHLCLKRPFDSFLWLLSIFLHHLVIPGILKKGIRQDVLSSLGAAVQPHLFLTSPVMFFSPSWGDRRRGSVLQAARSP